MKRNMYDDTHATTLKFRRMDQLLQPQHEVSMFGLMLILALAFTVMFVATAANAAPAIPPAYTLSAQDVESSVAAAIAEKGVAKLVHADVIGLKQSPIYQGAAPVTAKITSLNADVPSSRWSANLMVLGASGEVITVLPIAGRFQEMVEVPVLKRQLRSGDVIAEADIGRMEFPLARTRNDIATDATQLLGLSPRAAISPNRAVRLGELASPSVLKKNAVVQMIFQTGRMEISTLGQALTQGAKGDIIEVRNMNSKQVVRAVVENANLVKVLANNVEQLAGAPNAAF